MLPQELITLAKLHTSRRLLLHNQIFLSQAPSPTPNDHITLTPINHDKNNFDADVVMVLSVLICAVICSLFINSLLKCVLKCSTIFNRDANHYLTRVNLEKLSQGVDKRALKTFPVVKYSNDQVKTMQGLSTTDCVICLAEFKESERVRILPKCNHGFHVNCIDKWLSSHTSCPTCRQSLVDTCQKIIGSCHGYHEDDDLHATVSSPSPSSSPPSLPSSVGVTGEMVVISMVPLERETMVTNYRGNDAEQS